MTKHQTENAPTAAIGGPRETLEPQRVRAFVEQQLSRVDLDGRRLCLLVPDATRSCPLPLLVDAVHSAVVERVSALTVLVALGTHAPMSEERLAVHLGYDDRGLDVRYPGTTVLDHAWWSRETFVTLGTISSDRVAEITNGLLRRAVDVRVNRAVVDHDVTLVVGPVFPHEVVGFSGGNKYVFPGVGGQEIIDISHWVGALITSAEIIGVPGVTPVRALIDEAAALVPSVLLALCVVVRSGSDDLHAVTFGDSRAAWSAAADVSGDAHVTYVDAPYARVLSVVPARYGDMWTAAKGFYKVEPVVADGGEVVVLAPHVRELSAVHKEIERIGYHCRDYFTAQWERFKDEPWGTLAHSTHLRGAGTYDANLGERCRVGVTLATGIDRQLVERVNLGFRDPRSIDVDDWRRDSETLVVPNAGEVLYRLRSGRRRT